MFSYREALWPVVVFEFQGLQSLEQHRLSLALWDDLFARGEKILVLRIFHDEDALLHPEGAAKATKAWLRAGASESIKNQVLAMINVVPESTYDAMQDKSVEAVFGVPGGVFKSTGDAAQWFNSQVGPGVNLTLDPELLESEK